MKITSIKTQLITFDSNQQVHDGRPQGKPLKIAYPLVTIGTDEGLEGHSMGYGIHGDGASVAEALRESYFTEIYGKNPMYSESIWQSLVSKQRHMYNFSDSFIGVLDVAIWDLKGKIADLPVAALLGINKKSIPSYATARSRDYTPEEVYNEVLAMKAAGYKGYKLQICNGPEKDIPRFESAREAAGDYFPLMEDPGSAYTFQQALTSGYALDRLGYYWFEEPLKDRNMYLINQLASRLKTSVVPTETSMLFELPNYLKYDYINRLRGDVLLKGGITGLRKAMALGELHGINVEIHTANSPLLDVANLHVACASVNNEFIESHHPMFRFGLKNNPLEIDPLGMIHMPEKPGLGVDVDWDWMENHTTEIRTKTDDK